jgi:ABC-type amino acid transport substrate-binding protein
MHSALPNARARALLLALLLTGTVPQACAAGARQGPAVRFAPEKDYGPFVYQDEAGVVRGLSVDFVHEIAAAAGLQVATLPARHLSEILALARQGDVDLISSLRPDPERAAYLGFTRAYVSVPAVLITKADAPGNATLAAYGGRPVAVGKGYGVEAFARQAFPAVHWVPVGDDGEALQRLQSGDVSAVVADIASFSFISRQRGLAGLQAHADIGFHYALSLAYRKDWPELGDLLEQGLRAMPQARREAILQHWLAGTMMPKDPRREKLLWAGGVLAALALCLLMFGWINRRRRHAGRS